MVFDVVRALGRRWYVVLVGLVLTAGMVFGAYKASPPEYNARALVLLLPSKSDVGRGGNPLLHLSGLEQPAGILAAYFSSTPARTEVEALSPTVEFEVGIDDSTRGPVIAVDVTDDTAADTLKVLDYLLERIPEQLGTLQQEVDARGDAVVGSMALAVDNEAKVDVRGTIRLMIAALVVGLVGTGLSAYAVDGLLQRRKLSKPSGDRVSGKGGTDETDEDAAISWDTDEPWSEAETDVEPLTDPSAAIDHPDETSPDDDCSVTADPAGIGGADQTSGGDMDGSDDSVDMTPVPASGRPGHEA